MRMNIRGLMLGVALAGLAGGVLAQAPTTSPSEPPNHPWEGHGGGGEDGEHGDHHHWHPHRWGHGHWGHGRPGLLGNLRELDLTQAQREQIHTIMQSGRDQWKKPQDASPGKNPMAALENPGDPGYAAAVQAAKLRAGERIQAMSDLQTKIYNVLTPQQKTELSRRLAQKAARWEQWQQSHEGHGPEGGHQG